MDKHHNIVLAQFYVDRSAGS